MAALLELHKSEALGVASLLVAGEMAFIHIPKLLKDAAQVRNVLEALQGEVHGQLPTAVLSGNAGSASISSRASELFYQMMSESLYAGHARDKIDTDTCFFVQTDAPKSGQGLTNTMMIGHLRHCHTYSMALLVETSTELTTSISIDAYKIQAHKLLQKASVGCLQHSAIPA